MENENLRDINEKIILKLTELNLILEKIILEREKELSVAYKSRNWTLGFSAVRSGGEGIVLVGVLSAKIEGEFLFWGYEIYVK